MKNENKGIVSVIIPTYNRQNYLQEAIQSCIDQTYRPIECIIVDDGSTDGTKSIVESLIKTNVEHFTIKYIYQQNAGSQVARNTGTKACSGEFIQYLDSDDLLYPEKIEKQVRFLNQNKDCDGVWGGWAKGSVQKNELIQSFAREDLLTQFLTDHCVVNFSFLMRRKIIEQIGPWDVKIRRNQEIDFQIRGLLQGAKYQYQPHICGLWRIHEGERIANKTGGAEIFNFYKKWEKVLIDKGLFSENIKNNIANIFVWRAWENANNLKRNEISFTLLMEAFRLNPAIPFANSARMKFLRRWMPIELSIKLWWWWARRNAIKNNTERAIL